MHSADSPQADVGQICSDQVAGCRACLAWGLVQKEKERGIVTQALRTRPPFYLPPTYTTYESPTNWCPRLTYHRSRSRSKQPAMHKNDVPWTHFRRTRLTGSFVHGSKAGKKTHGQKIPPLLRRNRPFRYRQGILGSIFHPIRRCPIIIGAQVLLDCIQIQSSPVSYLPGPNNQYPHTYTAPPPTCVLPFSTITSSSAFLIPSHSYLRSLIGPLATWIPVGLHPR